MFAELFSRWTTCATFLRGMLQYTRVRSTPPGGRRRNADTTSCLAPYDKNCVPAARKVGGAPFPCLKHPPPLVHKSTGNLSGARFARPFLALFFPVSAVRRSARVVGEAETRVRRATSPTARGGPAAPALHTLAYVGQPRPWLVPARLFIPRTTSGNLAHGSYCPGSSYPDLTARNEIHCSPIILSQSCCRPASCRKLVPRAVACVRQRSGKAT
eukprot:gene11597-biopygen10921